MIRLPVAGYADSTLTAYSEEDWTEDDPEIEAVCAAYRAGKRRALVFDAGQAEALWAGLVTLSNTEDEAATQERRDPERRRMCRAASVGLSGLAGKAFDVLRAREG